MENNILLRYSRNSRKEGIRNLILYFLGCGLLAFIFYCFLRAEKCPPSTPDYYWLFMGGTALMFIIGLLVHVVPNIIMNKDFSLIITRESIECEVPSKHYGPSFHVKIKDIDKIIEHNNDGSVDWYIITRQNEKIKITSFYKNPILKIIEILQAQNPNIKLEEESD